MNFRTRNDRINDLYETDKKWALITVLNRTSRVFVHSADESSGFDYRPQFFWEESYQIDLLISMKQTYTTEDARQLTIG